MLSKACFKRETAITAGTGVKGTLEVNKVTDGNIFANADIKALTVKGNAAETDSAFVCGGAGLFILLQSARRLGFRPLGTP